MNRFFRKLTYPLACFVNISLLAREYAYLIGMSSGNSMFPTVEDKDLVLVRRMNRYDVDIGDIVALRHPTNPYKLLCKRITHLDGEFVDSGSFSGFIPKGHIWVEGDNKFRSMDSEYFGPVPKGLIEGVVVFKLWPFGGDLERKNIRRQNLESKAYSI